MAEPITFDTERSLVFEVNEESRTIKGLVLPFGVVGDNGKGKYSFAAGTVSWPADMSRVKLLIGHDFEKAVGHAVALEQTTDGVVGTFKVARGAEGDRALSMATDKVWDGLSAGLGNASRFVARGGVQHAVSADISETSLTPLPAFADARVTSVAASAAPSKEDNMTVQTTEDAPVAFSQTEGTALAAEVKELGEKFAALDDIKIPVATGVALTQVNEEPIYRFSGTTAAPSGFDFATDLLAAATRNDGAALKRLTDFTADNLGPTFVTTGNTATVNPSTYRPDLFLGQAPAPANPLYSAFYKGSLSDVTPFFWSKLDRTATTVGVANHTEGTEPTATNFATAAGGTVTPSAVSGKVHINREVSDQGGNPQISGMIWNEFTRSFGIALEAKTVALVQAVTGSITSLTAAIAAGASGAEAGAALETGLLGLQFNPEGSRFTRFWGHVDLYTALANARAPRFSGDTVGERLYPIINPQNRDGISGNKFSFIEIAGYRLEPGTSLGATSTSASNSYMADPAAVYAWNSGLTQLSKLGEDVEGYDIGCFAYWAGVVHDVTGLRKIAYDPAA